MESLAFSPEIRPERHRIEIGDSIRVYRRLGLGRIKKRLVTLSEGRDSRAAQRLVGFTGGRAGLDLEATLERIIPGLLPDRSSIMVRRSEIPTLKLLLLFDTSLSMHGRHRILASVSGAVAAREAALGSLALVGFHARPELIVRFGERVGPLEAAYRVLNQPLGGVTDLNAALAFGRKLINSGPSTGSGGAVRSIMITDAERTAGPDPRIEAARYKHLNVVHIGRRNRNLARDMARLGHGHKMGIENLESLPGALQKLLERLNRSN